MTSSSSDHAAAATTLYWLWLTQWNDGSNYYLSICLIIIIIIVLPVVVVVQRSPLLSAMSHWIEWCVCVADYLITAATGKLREERVSLSLLSSGCHHDHHRHHHGHDDDGCYRHHLHPCPEAKTAVVTVIFYSFIYLWNDDDHDDDVELNTPPTHY